MDNTANLVILDKREYRELTAKAAIYDVFARKIAADKERNGYVSEYEAAMFVVDTPTVDVGDVLVALGLAFDDEQEEDTEDVVDTIPDEEWEQIAALMNDKEEDNGTEEL